MKLHGKTVYRRNPARIFREAEMVLLFREGQTLQEIGARFGVSRERVRQCLTRLGLAADCGGAALKSMCRVIARAAATAQQTEDREQRIRAKHDLSLSEWRAIGPRGRGAYRRQVQNSRSRGIPWNLTMGQWWRIWQESGHWGERGRGHGYCMARWADEGPYSPENVYITTNSENTKHGYIVKPAAMRAAKAKVTRETKNF